MRIGSLFSGIGGFDLGFERAGHRVVWHSEIDRHASAILAEHWPDVPNLGDLCDLHGGLIEPVDVICGGFPCQDLSVAGKRAGFAGARSSLVFQFLRIVKEMREATDGKAPTFVVLENVPGLFSSHGGRDFGVLLDALGELRPVDLCWRVLDSRYFGVAQRRRRVFIVLDLGGERAEQVLLEPESLRGDPAAGRAAREDVAGTPGGGSAERGWPDDTDRMTFVPAVAVDTYNQTIDGTVTQSLRSSAGGGAYDRCVMVPDRMTFVPDVAYALACHAAKGGDPSTDNYVTHAAPTITATNDPSRSPQSSEVTQQVEACLTAGAGVRRLTPRECERLQGFPDDWTATGQYPDGKREPSDSARYRALGNAVTANVAHWIARRIVAAVRKEAAA